jgi:acyl-homoserine lactone synthase
MIEIVTKHNANLYPEALRQMFHLRHLIFVEQMHWEALRRPDGLEKDEFDTEDTIYLILQDDDGRLIGSHRFLPTLKPHVVGSVFHDLCNKKGVQVGPRIYEIGRSCIDTQYISGAALETAKAHLAVGVMEFALMAGVEHLTSIGSLHYLQRLLARGWRVMPLGYPREIDGVNTAAYIWPVDEESVASTQAYFGVHDSVVQYIGPHLDGMPMIEHLQMPDMPAVPTN